MIIKTILVGLALDVVSIDELQKPGWFTTYYEGVVFQVWGTLDINVTGKGRSHVKWDTRHPISWGNYLKAREKLAKTPVPYGVACSTPSATFGTFVACASPTSATNG